jgi:DNA-binding MarR family transcriptional regulator
MANQPRLLTNHARVLLSIADDCDVRMRDLAERVDLTERAAYNIVCDLVSAGLISRSRNGRRNCYALEDVGASRELSQLEQLTDLLARSREAG